MNNKIKYIKNKFAFCECPEIETNDVDDFDMPFMKPDELISVQDNHIYMYSEITPTSSLSFNLKLNKIEKNNQINKYMNDLQEDLPIFIHLNTPGGYIDCALTMYEAIKKCTSKTISIVEGNVASAGVLLTVAAKDRRMYSSSVMLIHQLRGGAFGTYQNIKDASFNADIITDIVINILLESTKLTKEKIDELLPKDIYLVAEECKKYGLINTII